MSNQIFFGTLTPRSGRKDAPGRLLGERSAGTERLVNRNTITVTEFCGIGRGCGACGGGLDRHSTIFT